MKTNLIKTLSRKTLERILKDNNLDFKGSRKDLNARVHTLSYSCIKRNLDYYDCVSRFGH